MSARLVSMTVVALLVLVACESGAWPIRAQPLPDAVTLSVRTLDGRYATVAEAVRENLARSEGGRRAAVLASLARADRQLLHFDGTGDGLAVEVLGDLATAERVAVVVPGANATLESFDAYAGSTDASLGGGARALYRQARRLDPDARIAVIAWLGYDAPAAASPDIALDQAANAGAPALRAMIEQVHGLAGAEIALICHSYGALLCGRAVAGLPVTDLAVHSSPGLGVDHVDALGTDARVWAGTGAHDWVEHVPDAHVSIGDISFGFGPDPTGTDFGARVYDAGHGGHSDGLRRGTTSLVNLAWIALGGAHEVSLAE